MSPTERRQLTLARARWAQHEGADYTVESRVTCFCPPEWSYWTRLTVRGGLVVQVEAAKPFLDGRITCQENIVDCGSLHEMRNLRIP